MTAPGLILGFAIGTGAVLLGVLIGLALVKRLLPENRK